MYQAPSGNPEASQQGLRGNSSTENSPSQFAVQQGDGVLLVGSLGFGADGGPDDTSHRAGSKKESLGRMRGSEQLSSVGAGR